MEIWRSSNKDWIGLSVISILVFTAGGIMVALFVFKLRSIALKEKLEKERENDKEEQLILKWQSQTLKRKKTTVSHYIEYNDKQIEDNKIEISKVHS